MTESVAYGVWLYGDKVGSLVCHHNTSSFSFDPEYLSDGARNVLGLRFEQDLTARFASNVRLPVWFSNLLPEGILREWIAEERGVSKTREAELLAQVGGDLPGAVEVLPSNVIPRELPNRQIFAEPLASNSDQVGWSFSLAGVGLKFSMLRDTDRFTCPASGTGGDWIIKLPDKIYRGVPVNEFAMMGLAKLAGIEVPDINLVHRENIVGLPKGVWPDWEEFAFGVRRFDRGPLREKIHIEDLAQVRGFYPEDKYYGNFETVASLVYRGFDVASLIEFARRLTFNILIGNGDAHLKNWSLIYSDRRRPTLSPAYDLVATGLYVPQGEVHNLGLRFGGSRRFEEVRLWAFARLAARLGVSVDLDQIADETITRAVESWPAVADLLADAPDVRDDVERSIAARVKSLRSGRAGDREF